MAAIKHRLISVYVLGIFFIACIAAGIYREEFLSIITNATVLCFSCIGIK